MPQSFVLTRAWLAPLLAATIFSCASEASEHDAGDVDAETLGYADPRTFYVSSAGDDGNTGLHESRAWRTIDRVNAEDLEPGDTVLFKGGEAFSGTLKLDTKDGGSKRNLVRVSSYGDGRAEIAAASGDGITITDASHIVVEQLLVTGGWDSDAQSGNSGEGVSAVSTVRGARRKDIAIRDIEVRGFKLAGIGIHARRDDLAKDSGFDGFEIRDCEVHDNGDFGVLSDGPYDYENPGYSHAHFTLHGVRSHHNRGLANKGEHTGSGIVLSDVKSALIEHSVAHHNGELNDHDGGGGYGIWAWDSDRVTIQFCESYANRTMTADGGGFDLDGGMTHSVMQFNYSHDNQGAGFGAFQFAYARPYSDNLIQYNISQDDGFSFLVWDGYGDMGSIAFVQNVGYGLKPVVATFSALADATFANNIFYGLGPQLFDVYEGDGMVFQGNDYWTASQPFAVAWNTGTADPQTFASFEAYRSATGAEMLDGKATGLHENPELLAAGSGGTLDDTTMLPTLTMYQLRQSSPLVDRGVNLEELGITAATRDFFGGPSPAGEARDVGVHELR